MAELNNNIKNERHFYLDLSFWSLLISNIIIIVWALKEEWSLGMVVWIYFCQNIILGFFWAAKVFAAAIDSSYTKKVQSVAVFLPQYFILHYVYATCLYDHLSEELTTNFKYIIAMAGIFLLSEIITFFAENRPNHIKPLSLAKVQSFPYARILPMNFIIIGGFILEARGTSSLLIAAAFLSLKALADIAMYMVERSSVFGSFVTDMFEEQKKKGDLDLYPNLKGKQVIYRKGKEETS